MMNCILATIFASAICLLASNIQESITLTEIVAQGGLPTAIAVELVPHLFQNEGKILGNDAEGFILDGQYKYAVVSSVYKHSKDYCSEMIVETKIKIFEPSILAIEPCDAPSPKPHPCYLANYTGRYVNTLKSFEARRAASGEYEYHLDSARLEIN